MTQENSYNTDMAAKTGLAAGKRVLRYVVDVFRK